MSPQPERNSPRVLNFGSVNIDHVYGVDHFVRPGETISGASYRVFMGGKGSNQSIALARAGARVFHAGKIGRDSVWIKQKLRAAGVDTSLLRTADMPGGHAIIQVNPWGENAIIVYGGANRAVTPADARRVLERFGPGDYLLAQNEISSLPYIMRLAAKRGMKIVFNPSPMDSSALACPLHLVDIFIVNEIEARTLCGRGGPWQILKTMRRKFPRSSTVMTLGRRGAAYCGPEGVFSAPAPRVRAVDTTAAGDTFTGYFLAGLAAGAGPREAIGLACRAAALCVTRRGAADSIPSMAEVTLRFGPRRG